MKLLVSSKAQAEIREAAAWYENQARGLSGDFLRAIALNFGHIERNPQMFSEVMPDVRRINLRRFPYSLFYRLHDPLITVLACLHQHRDPQDWPHN